MSRTALTSQSNPLRIAELAGGAIGITFAPGKQQAGAMSGVYRRDLATDLDAIAAWNAAAVVTLTEAHELEELGIVGLGAEVRRRHMEWHHWPIRDYGVPDAAFEAAWPARSAALRGLVAWGCRVLVHCKGGLGRAGMIAARLLVEMGAAPAEAITAVRTVRSGAVETAAQEAWVAAGCPALPVQPETGPDAAWDRAVGAMLGLAAGDAVGAAIEFQPKPRLALLDDMSEGGPHHLGRGQWTDDTAMALALADSLLEKPELDASDLMRRFLDWRTNGAYSCTGTCFDCGTTVDEALRRFRRTGKPLAGSTDPEASGNGALMRIAPVAIRHWCDRAAMARVAALQTRTTHGSPATLHASAVFTGLLGQAIAGVSLSDLLASPAAGQIEGGWRGLPRDAVHGTGYVVDSLQAAVWAVSRTTDFRSAVLLAANLGQDADTTAAIAGQLAGAVYGMDGIPAEWREALAWREHIEDTAGRLFDAGLASQADGDWSTRDWTLQERLAALAAFAKPFDRDGFVFARLVPPDNGALGWFKLSDEGQRFYQMVYDYGWVRMFDWSAWREAEGERLMHDPAAMVAATADDLLHVLTTCVRADRFCDGYLAEAYNAGLIRRVVARAAQLAEAD